MLKKCLIFQIGFNKCGTNTLHAFFKKNNIPSAHHTSKGQKLSTAMFNNYKNEKPVLHGFIDRITAFSDFGVYICNFSIPDILFDNIEYNALKNDSKKAWYEVFQENHHDYDKLYILNIRSVNKWLCSRYFHNRSIKNAILKVKQTFNEDIDEVEVLYRWKSLWYKYHSDVLKYFNTHNLRERLLIFDIENDQLSKLSEFLNRFGFDTNGDMKIHKNQTRRKPEKLENWKRIEKMHPDLSTSYIDHFECEYDRIIAHYDRPGESATCQ